MGDLASAFPAFSEADWRKAAEAALKGASLETLNARTSDGLPLAPIYVGAEGPRALRDAGGAWRALARLDHPDAGAANEAALEDLANGADGLQVVFAGAAGAYGYGLAKWDSAALHRALDGVRFDFGAAFELDLGPDAEAQASAFAALVVRSGARPDEAGVSFGLDPIGLSLRSGRAARRWEFEGEALTRLVAGLKGQGFRGPFVAADGRPVHAAGGTPAQELAYALGAAVGYWRALESGGLSPENARAAISFRLAADADQFVTLAKFRAVRRLWARIGEAAGLPPQAARVHAESAWRMMSARDPFVNVMRAALAAFSAGLGGADSVSLLPFSRAIGLPDAFARRLARNTQLIELRELNFGFVADPAAGAGVFEALTNGLSETAWSLFQSFERAGGLPDALRSGEFQKAIGESAKALARDVARLKAPITGVSAHPDLGEARIEVLPANPPKAEFAGEAFAAALAPLRVAEPFERLRDAAEALAERPRVFLAAIGSPSAHARRVGFARDLFEAGGIETIADSGASKAEDSATRFLASGAAMACLCGSDDAYREHAEAFARALKAAGANHLMLAGRPGDQETAWRAAGIDGFIFAGGDAVAILDGLLRRAGAVA